MQEIKEAVELPLTHPELYEDIGIRAPKGVILYGGPGTGKTLLAKAVAHSTSATFLRVVGSELIQKYLGDGPKLVRGCVVVSLQEAAVLRRNCLRAFAMMFAVRNKGHGFKFDSCVCREVSLAHVATRTVASACAQAFL